MFKHSAGESLEKFSPAVKIQVFYFSLCFCRMILLILTVVLAGLPPKSKTSFNAVMSDLAHFTEGILTTLASPAVKSTFLTIKKLSSLAVSQGLIVTAFISLLAVRVHCRSYVSEADSAILDI